MPRLIILVSIILTLSSCLTVKRIQRNCDKFAAVCLTDIENETIVRDTIVKLAPIRARLPVSDINLKLTLQVVNGDVNMPLTIYKSGIITVEFSITGNILNIHSFLNDSTILVQPDPIIIREATKETNKEQILPPVKYIPKVYKWSFIILILEVIVLILITYLKSKNKTLVGVLGSIKDVIITLFKRKT